jgi:ankyrin repeat protein
VDAQDLFEESSLHYAARNCDVEVVKALLIKSADVNKKNEVFNQKNSSQLCCGVKNEEGVSLEGETTCPLPI